MNKPNAPPGLLHGQRHRQENATAPGAAFIAVVVNMGMFESLANYFIKPVLLWLLAIFVIQAFFWPMATTWAGDMLAMFWQMAVDEAKDLFW